MNSCIYIDGFSLWVLLAMAVLLIAGFIILGCGYTEELRNNDRLKARLKEYEAESEERTLSEYKERFMRNAANCFETNSGKHMKGGE